MDLVGVDLESEIKKDSEIISLLKDKDTAALFYSALCNMRWKKKNHLTEEEHIFFVLKGKSPDVWSCSWRYAGGVIAEIRNEHYNLKEDYLDFYCMGNEGIVHDTVKQSFNRLGWTEYPWDD